MNSREAQDKLRDAITKAMEGNSKCWIIWLTQLARGLNEILAGNDKNDQLGQPSS